MTKNEKRDWKQKLPEIERSWENIGISNDFLFGKLMRSHPDLCRKLLQRILPELSIGRIEILEVQKSIKEDIDAKGVRLDVYLSDDEERIYSIEMQMAVTKELARRSRYYQAMTDLQLLDQGVSYRYLNDTYIIFICPFDLYGRGRHKYTFDGSCREDGDIKIDDGAVRIFLNAKGAMDDVSPALRAFLNYVAGISCKDPFVQELEQAVMDARRNREWRHEYMTLQMRDQENIEKGRELGREEGRKEEREEGIRLMIAALEEVGISKESIAEKVRGKYHLTEEEFEKYL